MKKVALLLFFVTLLSCSEYQKALKSEDISVKTAMASKMYEEKKYSKAIRLFEQLRSGYKGKPQGERIFYMFARSYYETKQYYLAGYEFESFSSSYPGSTKAEEAAFLGAKSYSMLSPKYTLDQVDTYKAIDKIQLFINTYPNSVYQAEANEIAKTLREKIEKKVFENAKLYNTIARTSADLNAAIVTLDNFLIDYPGTPYKEEALYYKFDSAYKLAINSVEYKKKERINGAIKAYHSLIKFKSDTKYRDKADQMFNELNIASEQMASQ